MYITCNITTVILVNKCHLCMLTASHYLDRTLVKEIALTKLTMEAFRLIESVEIRI